MAHIIFLTQFICSWASCENSLLTMHLKFKIYGASAAKNMVFHTLWPSSTGLNNWLEKKLWFLQNLWHCWNPEHGFACLCLHQNILLQEARNAGKPDGAVKPDWSVQPVLYSSHRHPSALKHWCWVHVQLWDQPAHHSWSWIDYYCCSTYKSD